jgi:hypothetical protein
VKWSDDDCFHPISVPARPALHGAGSRTSIVADLRNGDAAAEIPSYTQGGVSRGLLVGLIMALALPGGAQATDSLYLKIDRTNVAPGWWLGGSVVSAEQYIGNDSIDLTLRRPFPDGRGEESHALLARHEGSTLAFDGRSGSWRTTGQLGPVAVIDMEIEATGDPAPVRSVLDCHAETGWTATRVRLTGTFALSTGTRAFATIRRTRLTGAISRATGLLDCSTDDEPGCVRSTRLEASSPKGTLTASPRRLMLEFSERLGVGAPRAVNWYHVLRLDRFDAIAGTLPNLTVKSSPPAGIRGRVTFRGGLAREEDVRGCTRTSSTGVLTGSLTARFVGWGERTFRLGSGARAVYYQYR